MRTMAGFVFFSFVVACLLHQVFAIDCSSVIIDQIMNCNDCIRCGGFWCINPDNYGVRCTSQQDDNWCPDQENTDVIPDYPRVNKPGKVITPAEYTGATIVNQPTGQDFVYAYTGEATPKVHITLVNTTQSDNYKIEKITKCDKGKCTTQVIMDPKLNFCRATGTKYEFLNMKLHIDSVPEAASIKYHVPCACACSEKVEKSSATCNNRGDFSCGICTCHKGWSGKFCETADPIKCDNRRGDLQCTNPYKNEVECSGNGYCGPCDTCICYKDREGSQYFQEENYCADLCLIITSECELCLHDKAPGVCPDCPHLTIAAHNETLLAERDERNRKVWVGCPGDLDGCDYYAKRNPDGQMYVMAGSCNVIADAIAGGNVNIMLPTVLGIIAVVAAATAVAGYMVWKSRHAPMPHAASQYQELDGPEGSAGINPLYKSPTSSYNNPMWKGAKV